MYYVCFANKHYTILQSSPLFSTLPKNKIYPEPTTTTYDNPNAHPRHLSANHSKQQKLYCWYCQEEPGKNGPLPAYKVSHYAIQTQNYLSLPITQVPETIYLYTALILPAIASKNYHFQTTSTHQNNPSQHPRHHPRQHTHHARGQHPKYNQHYTTKKHPTTLTLEPVTARPPPRFHDP